MIGASLVATHLREPPRSRAWAHAAARCALIGLCAHSGAVPAAEWTLSGIVGAGNGVNVAGVEAQVPSGYGGGLTDQWSWSFRWAGNVAYWWARNHINTGASLWEMGLTPVVELRRAPASGVSFYVEGGVGIHLLSHTRIDERELSTAFQFGEFVGTGVNFGDRREYGVGSGFSTFRTAASRSRIGVPPSGRFAFHTAGNDRRKDAEKRFRRNDDVSLTTRRSGSVTLESRTTRRRDE